jgi:hypothetical protein
MNSKYVYSIIGTFVILLLGAGSITLNNENIYAQQSSETEPNPKLNATPPMSLNLTDEDVEVSDRPLNNISTLEGMEKSQIGDIIPGEQNMKFEGQQLQQLNQTNK